MGAIKDIIEQKIAEVSSVSHLFPSVTIIHNIQKGFTVEYMCDRGMRKLGVTRQELAEMGLDYYPRFFNLVDAEEYVPKMKEMIERNNLDEVFTFFQQVRTLPKKEWEWHLSSTKLFLRDEHGLPLLTITQAVPIESQSHLTQKVDRILKEHTFKKINYERYALLSPREKDVLRSLALVKSNKDIADEFFLSKSTVETHKKNIKQKLGIKSNKDLSFFARAFDLN